jgi:hypothetical protein
VFQIENYRPNSWTELIQLFAFKCSFKASFTLTRCLSSSIFYSLNHKPFLIDEKIPENNKLELFFGVLSPTFLVLIPIVTGFEQFEMYMIITDPKQTASTKKTFLGELTKFVQTESAGATIGKIYTTRLVVDEKCFEEFNNIHTSQ